MTKTVREWVEFLGAMGNNHKFALRLEDTERSFHMSEDYVPMDIALKEFEGWLDDIVVNVTINEHFRFFDKKGCYYYVLEYKPAK